MSELPNFSDEQDERLVLDERDLAFQEAAYWEIEREDAFDLVYEAYCAEMRLDALRRIGMVGMQEWDYDFKRNAE